MGVHAWLVQISATFRDFYVDLEISAQILKQCFIFYFILSLWVEKYVNSSTD